MTDKLHYEIIFYFFIQIYSNSISINVNKFTIICFQWSWFVAPTSGIRPGFTLVTIGWRQSVRNRSLAPYAYTRTLQGADVNTQINQPGFKLFPWIPIIEQDLKLSKHMTQRNYLWYFAWIWKGYEGFLPYISPF